MGQIEIRPVTTCYNCYNLLQLISTNLTFPETKMVKLSNELKIIAIGQRWEGRVWGGGQIKIRPAKSATTESDIMASA